MSRWPRITARFSTARRTCSARTSRSGSKADARVNGVDYFAALDARERFYASAQEIFPDYGTILTPAALGPAPKDLEYHRQSGLLRLLDLSRRAGRDAAAAGGRRHADGRAAGRPPARRRPPAAQRALAGQEIPGRQRLRGRCRQCLRMRRGRSIRRGGDGWTDSQTIDIARPCGSARIGYWWR